MSVYEPTKLSTDSENVFPVPERRLDFELLRSGMLVGAWKPFESLTECEEQGETLKNDAASGLVSTDDRRESAASSPVVKLDGWGII